MGLEEMGRAHLDGGLDALAAEDMPQALAIECLEAALLAAGLRLGLWLFQHRVAWRRGDDARKREPLGEALRAAGLGALSGAALSLVLSVALALVPGAQVWLTALAVNAVIRSLPSPRRDPVDLSVCRSVRSRAIG
jgi:hypothetical protein